MISICIIVKNDEENLNLCLKKLKPLDYEIVVIDTGSTDNTKIIASQYTNNLYDFSWCDDFSAARNCAIKMATQEYILMVDSDEYLEEFDKCKLEKLILSNPQSVGRIQRKNIFVRNGKKFYGIERVNRLFSKNIYHYVGKIHEQIIENEKEEYPTYKIPLSFLHSGYDGSEEERKKKANRNIEMLKRTLEEEGPDPYTLYQLGKGYYFEQDYSNATFYFDSALTYDLNPKLEYVIDMVEMYGYSLINSGKIDQALLLGNIYEEFSHSADFVYLMGFIYMNNGQFKEAIDEFLKATKYKECKVVGVNSYLAYYNVGVIYECLGQKDVAVFYYKQCIDYEPALQGVERCQ